MKQRLDVLLQERHLVGSRERAKAVIMAGQVLVNGQKLDKAGILVSEDAAIELIGNQLPYVSRGGLKLAKAIEFFGLSLAGKVVADIGASTGGFTDCALQNGAAKVFAIDVGYGQLAWKLRTDPRVVNRERTNIRHVAAADLGELVDLATIDVAFISLTKVLGVVDSLLKAHGEIVALIKPQFEAGKGKVGKHGVVRDPATHRDVIAAVIACARGLGLAVAGLTFSPVKGPEGNIEYLLRLTHEPSAAEPDVAQVVADAHALLDAKAKGAAT